MECERIFITGSSGSGKTVLAAKLGERLGISPFEMDSDPGAFETFDLSTNWIIEGAYVWEMDRILARTDVIVWLDVPMRYTLVRIVRRHMRLSLLGRNRHRGLRLLFHFLRSQPRFFTAPARPPTGPQDWTAITRANQEAMLRPYTSRTVTLRSPRETRRWLQRFTTGPAIAPPASPARFPE